jgi:hypothetical protein
MSYVPQLPQRLRHEVDLVGTWPADVQTAYAAYLALEPGKRSIRTLADATDQPYSELTNWCMEYHWIELSGHILEARKAAALSETVERLTYLSAAAAETLFELLSATKRHVAYNGDVAIVADSAIRLKAATEILDRAGASAIQRSAVAHTGPDGGQLRIAHLHADIAALTPAELLAELQDASRPH